MSEILPNLFLGPMGITYDKDFLQEYRITHVLSLFEEHHRTVAMMTFDIESLCFQLYDKDDEPIGDYFEKGCNYIHKAITSGGAVYVHCFAGISRSPTMVAAYLIRHHNMTATEALDFIRERRPKISPNDGFCKALSKWEQVCAKD